MIISWYVGAIVIEIFFLVWNMYNLKNAEEKFSRLMHRGLILLWVGMLTYDPMNLIKLLI